MTFTLFTYLRSSNNSVCFGIDTKNKILSYDYFFSVWGIYIKLGIAIGVKIRIATLLFLLLSLTGD